MYSLSLLARRRPVGWLKRVVPTIIGLVFVFTPMSGQEVENTRTQEIKKLEGTWIQESYIVDGKRLPDNEKCSATFQKNSVRWKFPPSPWPSGVSLIDHVQNEF